ncbi:Protein-lysine methyltransferase METTL21D [Seminavis robusta]|uniref:Protein-lysine methyltransferase METTL21D n=1 Tax=Seminavis robusta TaxID=568900 RepID=A0A9N8E194_9STRA|nr:Protein-lysine methyltransferase METTL21D [Seminavis robusta]|eukprot:Sro434_g142040.1 Protein-lysine methyltransferase METTL21D (315) ;mRNA; r:26449-27393
MKTGKRRKRQRQENPSDSTGTESEGKKRRKNTHTTSNAPPKDSMEDAAVIFQDAMTKVKSNSENGDEEDVANVFFDLANSPMVGFRIDMESNGGKKKQQDQASIVVQQNIGTTAHTGGIVWETAYLLLQYLLAGSNRRPLGKTLEVGAGCGLLGQVLAAHNIVDQVVMTEHAIVTDTGHLATNVERNKDIWSQSAPVYVENLDWENYERDTAKSEHLIPHSYDTIVGTDVVFTPKLVEPLWKTLKYMSHPKTNIYLCLQERCEASHKLLLEKASSFHFHLTDITNQLESIPSCKWGKDLDCRLFHITVNKEESS